MTTSVRFQVAVDEAWAVSVAGPDGPVEPAPPSPWPGGGPKPEPEGPQRPDRFLYQLWDASMTPDIPGIYKKIFADEVYEPADVEAFGRFLFDRLLGTDTWTAICGAAGTADFIELALRFDAQRYDLHRFPWELLHDGNGFLAQGHPAACVTRLVERVTAPGSPPPALPKAFKRPARLLFVVGASLKDHRIRPGAEVFGLLRQLHTRDLIVNTRIVHSTSPQGLHAIVEDYEPDLVHFICHGLIRQVGTDPPRGFLEFKSEDKKLDVEYRHADHIVADLRVGDRIPPLVVLSACYSGVAPGTSGEEEEWRVAAVDRVGSLAAELVAKGVPVVVGMGGRVSDSACRLFTRFFGEAVLDGESLVAAVARGRRAAFLWDPSRTADWAFPALFAAANLEVPYRPGQAPSGVDPCKVLRDRIHQGYGVPKYPVFCGRHEFLQRYELLFRPGAPPVLPIFTEVSSPSPGEEPIRLGRTRLLQELVSQSLRDGHIPCLVSSRKGDWPDPPLTGTSDLAIEILRAIDRAREVFELPPPLDSSVVEELIQSRKSKEERQDLRDRLKEVKKRSQFWSIVDRARKAEGSSPSDELCRDALQEDFQALIDEARKADPPRAGDKSRVVLLLDDVHRYEQAIHPLLHTLIDGNGLGSMAEPVPVILCYNLESTTKGLFTEASEKIGAWAMELQPFSDEGNQDLMAYEQVLLFPDPMSAHAKFAAKQVREKIGWQIEGQVASFAIDHRAKADVRDNWIQQFRWEIEGIPDNLAKKGMYKTAVGACWARFLVPGDDEARLAKL